VRNLDIDKWSHRAMPLYMVSILGSGGLGFLPEHQWWSRLISTVYIFPVLGFIILGQLHNTTSFCEYCAEKTPADTGTAVHQKRRSLRFYHRFMSWGGLLYLAAVIAVPSVLPRVWPSFIGWAALMPGFLWMIWSMRVHDLLKPWCPWCRNDGWNDDLIEEPAPDPHGRPLPVGGQ